MDYIKKKRTIIVSVYSAILLLILLGIYACVKPKPSCFDGQKNQNEENIDCGGVCVKKCEIELKENIAVMNAGAVESGIAGQYDIYGQVENPNSFYGSNKFSYTFQIKDAGGTVMAEKKGINYILPRETKYIVVSNINLPRAPASVGMVVEETEWVEFQNDYFERPQLNVVNKNYQEIAGGVGFAEATGLLKNESPFDFNKINLEVILKDGSGRIVALNSTKMDTVRSKENRDFRAVWPNRFSGTVANMEVQVEVNVFDSESFVKRFFKTQDFQRYDME
ncbi:MAG: hypothetical protein NTZ97_04890 [Candidatus Moranbacteria bacterium]|nr:hypothetical protein [Candidatus Moranbacteria bacterium]